MTILRRFGLTPAKAALIGVLALAMGWVWAPLLLGESKSPRRRAARAPRQSQVSADPIVETPGKSNQPTASPMGVQVRISLSEAIQHDPFAAPGWAPQATAGGLAGSSNSPSAVRQRFESLASPGVAMLLTSERGQAAQIGARTVHVGDLIDGFRVVEISQDGVRVVPDSTGDGHGA